MPTKHNCFVTIVFCFFVFENYICGNTLTLVYTLMNMENPTINDRIAELIKFLELSPTAFADEIGIQRSGLSHIMKGRNKPSLDVVQKIVTRFPDINLAWLVNGIGNISSSTPSVINLQQKQAQTTLKEPENPFKNTLFDAVPQETKGKEEAPPVKNNGFTHEDFVVKENPAPRMAEKTQTASSQQPFSNIPPVSPGKSIDKILIFYTDNTFEEFFRP